jgi:Fe-S cluster assembly protein SufB
MSVFKIEKGINKKIVEQISAQKNEPSWMLEFRLNALRIFEEKPMPAWGGDLSLLNPHDLYYYLKAIEHTQTSWDEVPDSIKNTFDALGIRKSEQTYLAGLGVQYESEMIYKQLKKQWADLGVIFCDTESGLKEHGDIFKRYFATVVPPHDNKFAALNSAVWSGGSFVYVPRDVRIDLPLQTYFRINAQSMGQFERTLIIADSGSFVHYVEGCSAPVYTKSSLHSAVVELIALPGAHIRYSTIQNWAGNVYNLVTKRAIAYEHAAVEWVDGNFGSKLTMKYPCVVLKGACSRATVISVAVAGKNQHQDSGAKIIHCAPHTHSAVVAKSISKNGGRSSYRGLLKITKNAKSARSRVQCDALILDGKSRADTYPTLMIENESADIGHEASVSNISKEQLFYAMSRGLTAQLAQAMIMNGFISVFVDQLPMEYAVEINRLIALDMEGSVG